MKQTQGLWRATLSIQKRFLNQYEDDTWYDSNGRIVFSAKNMGELAYKRNEWNRNIKNIPVGKTCCRTYVDDTVPGGPVERTIEYVAPFDRCDREKDYEIAWKFFEEKYGKIKE
ncbi:MAG: hypothetical protein HFH97_14855 [Lachnospiraceae bacterium]|nr:hypothetical protein [uncultured Acetatifactor sp.]MCI9230094.1 hypothetical protein [Lachnospiraceae bacterium]MCI9573862.1 hypothetical protein [Lachnospiraceae bacterium]